MSLQDAVLDALEDLEYPNALEEGVLGQLDTVQFSKIVSWLARQLNDVQKEDNYAICEIETDKDNVSFKIELNSLLRDLGAHLSPDSPMLDILHYLTGEVFAARILASRGTSNDQNSMEIELQESDTAKNLKIAILTLGLGKPPEEISAAQLFSKLLNRLKERSQELGLLVENALVLDPGMQLSPKQWQVLDELQAKFCDDYSLRKSTLLTRLECTVGSFKWKEGLRSEESTRKLDEVCSRIQTFNPKSTVTVADALAARHSDSLLLLNSVVSSHHELCTIVAPDAIEANQGLLQRQSLHQFIIGTVPDRGGRPLEQAPPSRESFDQQKHQRDGQQSRGRGRGGRGQRNSGDAHRGKNQSERGGGARRGYDSQRSHQGNADNYQAGGAQQQGTNWQHEQPRYVQQFSQGYNNPQVPYQQGPNYYQQVNYDNFGDSRGPYQQSRGQRRDRRGQH